MPAESCAAGVRPGARAMHWRTVVTRRAKAIVAGSALLALLGVLALFESAREEARRQNDLSNVKALMCVLQLYAHDYGEALPPDLGLLFEGDYCTSGRVYVSPDSATRPPMSGAEMRAGQCDYLYYGKGLRLPDCSEETVILMTRPGVRKRTYVSLGFADGHVEGHSSPPLLNPVP
jgi:hypothetical protein